MRSVAGAERDVERCQRFGQPVAPPRSDQRHDVLAAAERPGDGELRHGDAAPRRDGCQRFHQRGVLPEILAFEARQVRALHDLALHRRCRDQPARQHAIGGDADPQRAQLGQDASFDAARDERILDLQVAHRRHRMGALHGRRR
jgi:hypothetical protein